MPKTARLTLKIVLAAFLSTIACVLVYCLFLPLSLGFDAEETKSFLIRMVTVGLLMDTFATWVVYRLYRPIARAMIAEGDRAPKIGADDRAKGYAAALLALERIPNFILLVGVCGYIGSASVNLAIDLARGTEPDWGLVASRFVLASAWGFLNGIVTARLVNMFLIEAKFSLRIFDLSALSNRRGGRYLTMRGRLLQSGIALFFFLMAFAGVVFYVRLRDLGELVASGADAAAFVEAASVALREGVGIFAGLLVIATALYFVVLAEIQAHFNELLGQVARMAEGDRDLAKRVHVVSFDDIGRMTSSFNRILGALAETFRGVRTMTKSVYVSSETIRAASGEARKTAAELQRMAAATETSERARVAELGSAVSSFKSAAEKISRSTARTADEARGVSTAAGGFRSMVEALVASGQEASRVEAAFGALSSSAREGAAGVSRGLAAAREIDEAGERVGAVARIIADVAERSNLLAMNASIEAAHGGEAGKGFGVVAREMKKLAESVARSARDIDAEVKAVVETNHETAAAVQGLGLVFDSLSSGIDATGGAIAEIAGSAHRNAEEARRDLVLLERLGSFIAEIVASERSARESVAAMEAAIERLSGSQAESGQVSATLTDGVRSIVGAFDSLDASLASALDKVSALEERVASYKLD